jgi:hypothetical protein
VAAAAAHPVAVRRYKKKQVRKRKNELSAELGSPWLQLKFRRQEDDAAGDRGGAVVGGSRRARLPAGEKAAQSSRRRGRARTRSGGAAAMDAAAAATTAPPPYALLETAWPGCSRLLSELGSDRCCVGMGSRVLL